MFDPWKSGSPKSVDINDELTIEQIKSKKKGNENMSEAKSRIATIFYSNKITKNVNKYNIYVNSSPLNYFQAHFTNSKSRRTTNSTELPLIHI